MASDGMPLQPDPKDQRPPEAAQRDPLLDNTESFGSSLGFVSFHGIIQNASLRLVVGAAAESSASGFGLDLLRSTGKNALGRQILITAAETFSPSLSLRLLGRVGLYLAPATTAALMPVGSTAAAATTSRLVVSSVAPL